MAMMTDDEILALMMLLTTERRLQAADVGEGLTGRIGSESGRTHALAVLRSLERGGAACRIAGPHSPWEITEKGRIAAALLMHKKPDLREVFIDCWDAETKAADPEFAAAS
jgi:hypothetical protein